MRKTKKLLCLFAFCASAIVAQSTTNKTIGHTFFAQRAQEWDLARNLSGITQFIAPCDIDCLNGFISITPAYTRNFNRDELGSFFWFNGTNTMTFDNIVSLNSATDVFGRNIFLNDNFDGRGTILPRVENFLVDLRLRLNLDEWVCGLYFDIHAPINWTRWNMNLDESLVATGSGIEQFALGNATAAPSPVNSIIEAFNGQLLNVTVFQDLKRTLQYGRIDGKQSKTSLADITVAFGYNFICNDCAHLGLDVRAIFPTGTRPDAEFLFEPVVGNGKHFEVGFGLNGHYEFWNNACDSSFSFWAEGVLYHMFKAQQRRIFDLKNFDPATNTFSGTQNIGSNRLLIKKFSGVPNDVQLTEILFGPNVLARQVKVKNNIHSEIVVLFDYQRCGFTLDVGYDFWVRTKDKLSNIEPIDPQTYGLAGLTLGTGGATANNTDSTAKINGTGNPAGDATNIYIATDSLSLESAAHPTALSHKVFAHAGYAWDSCDYTPFLGAGGAVEFSGRNNNALDQWEIWIKGGFAFM